MEINDVSSHLDILRSSTFSNIYSTPLLDYIIEK